MTNIIKNRNADPAAFGSVLDQLFPKNLTTFLDDAFWGFDRLPDSGVPAVNIRETVAGYEIELAAPGFRKSDFQLKIDGDTLRISMAGPDGQANEIYQGDNNTERKQEGDQVRWIKREFMPQAFERHFELGDVIDREKITARYENGVLYVNLPKTPQVRPASRQIDIN
jgi:HSP20 family protein